MKNLFFITFIFALNIPYLCYDQSKADPCDILIPLNLREAIKKEYPKYRIVRSNDYSQEIQIYRMQWEQNPAPCPFFASADVDGDGVMDYALLLADESEQTILVAARNDNDGKLHISKLLDFRKGELGHSYVEPIKAGTYQDMYAITSGYIDEPGRKRIFTSMNPGFLAGTIGSSGGAFFFDGNQWVWCWLYD